MATAYALGNACLQACASKPLAFMLHSSLEALLLATSPPPGGRTAPGGRMLMSSLPLPVIDVLYTWIARDRRAGPAIGSTNLHHTAGSL